MLPSSHLVPINLAANGALAGATALADAFSEFTAAASRLEKSYQELQKEVTQLRAILAERSQALRSSRAENAQMKMALRQILDSLPCGVLVLEGNSRIALINPEARRLLDITGEQLSTLEDIPVTRRAPLETTLQNSSCEGSEDEFCITSPQAKRWLAVRSRRLYKRGANVATAGSGDACPQQQTILILRDTTNQKQLETEREAARNVVALAEVATILAHEIRNPLASLELFAGLIGERSAGAEEYVSHLRAGIRSLSATVNNVLRFHSAGSLQHSRVVLGDTLRGAVEFVRPLAEQRQVELSLLDQTKGLVIAGDENALQQLFLNLGLNAFRHTAAGGCLQIFASRTACDSELNAKIEFTDSGCGIAPELLGRIFEAGFSTTGQTPGLGLAVCRKIVEQHGGTISVSSRMGRGTTFSLEFPSEP